MAEKIFVVPDNISGSEIKDMICKNKLPKYCKVELEIQDHEIVFVRVVSKIKPVKKD